ncbi:DNA polymerase alpha subunit B isoform X2 [Periplaneta americana]
MAFSVSHLRGADPTLDTLVQMERKEFGKKQEQQSQPQQQPSRSQENTLVIYLGKDSATSACPDLGDDILEAYNSTPKAKSKIGRKKNEHTPDNRPGSGRSPRAIFSPASFSPTVATPSSKYRTRTNKGDAVCVFGEAQTTSWYSQNNTFKVHVQLPPSHLKSDACYMFAQLREVVQTLSEVIHHLSEEMISKFSLEELQPINIPCQSQFAGAGRICCDSNGRLNAKSLTLECAEGKTVQLDVSQVESYSLFPGQVVVVEGDNPMGNRLSAKQIHCDASLPLPPKPSLSTKETGPIQIVIAAGPFTQSDNMTFQPLEDLVEYIEDHKPHLVILTGPFIDASHPVVVQGMLAETYSSFFEKIVDGIMEPLKKLNTHVVLIPSFRDVHHHSVYPVPPFMLRKHYTNLTLAPDPCILNVDGLVIGATSTDILFHLGKEEISQVRPGSDRLGRLASHILSQQAFYPLYPPVEEINIDMELWAKYGRLDVTPHILILPSDLRCFIKNLNGCIVVNPERLAKGLIGGNFARLQVSCIGEEVSVNGQIVKI